MPQRPAQNADPAPGPAAEPVRDPAPEPIPLRPRTAGATERPRPAPRAPETPAAIEVDVTAGPFADTAEVREFERALAQLPGVREVSLRGYQTGDRAILEVQLERQTP
jgi:hypothetical protein